jgi:dolichol-phosphate mannosyltransferase
MADMDVIVIPTYNEAENISDILDWLVEILPSQSAHIVVVDDSSPDGTGDLVRSHPHFATSVFLETRAAKGGLGNAYRHGFGWAHDQGYDRVVQMDADGSHAPAAVPELLRALEEADIAVGSRYVTGGRTVDWPLHRELVSRLGNRYVRSMLGLPVRDSTSGFRAYRTAQLAMTVTAGTEANGYCFQIESTWRAARAGLELREVPIEFTERRRGHSKMGIGIVVEALWRVAQWRFLRADVSQLEVAARDPAALVLPFVNPLRNETQPGHAHRDRQGLEASVDA